MAIWKGSVAKRRMQVSMEMQDITPHVLNAALILYKFFLPVFVHFQGYIYQYARIFHPFFQVSNVLLRNVEQAEAQSLQRFDMGIHI